MSLPDAILEAGSVSALIGVAVAVCFLSITVGYLIRRLTRLLADLFFTPKDDDHGDAHH